MKKIAMICALALSLTACSYGNKEDVKANAEETWKANGFQVVGYLGYEIGPVIPFTNYGGAYVWYTLHKIPDNGITYTGALQQWGDEVHVYNIRAKDAIQPQNE